MYVNYAYVHILLVHDVHKLHIYIHTSMTSFQKAAIIEVGQNRSYKLIELSIEHVS